MKSEVKVIEIDGVEYYSYINDGFFQELKAEWNPEDKQEEED